jgi:N-methylhydantoinase B
MTRASIVTPDVTPEPLVQRAGWTPPPPHRLRDLSDQEFTDLYQCDRFTATVLANRFRYVVSHMSNQFRWHAFSAYIRDAADLCGTLSGPPSLGYPMAAVSETVPLFYGSIPDAIRIVVEEYGLDRLAPGDTLIVNDYYRVGTHFNDACCIRPVFHHGSVVGVVSIRAHLLDIGGSVFGGWSVTTRSTYQNGLRIPPMLLYSRGEPVESTFKLLFDNTRLAELMMPDLKTEYRALELADRLLQETITKYGLESYTGAIRYACDAADEAMREALGALPDGVYEGEETLVTDGFPDSPQYHIRVRVTKVGERAEFDLSDCSPATRGSINCSWLDTKTAVAMALKLLIDPRNPMTSGTLRSMDVVVSPGAICNPYPPQACQYYYVVVMAIVHAIFRALNPLLGPNAVSAGFMGDFAVMLDSASGATEEYPETASGLGGACGPWGATRHGDGDSGEQPVFMNLNITGGVEMSETMFSEAVVLRSEYVPDTGGPGNNRGGASTVHETMARTSSRHHPLFDKPVGGGGVYGGKAGALSAATRIEPSDANRNDCLFYPALDGPVTQITTSGGGGWGDPLERDPERVKVDVRDGYVSIEGAARDYGVVVVGDPARYPDRLAVDHKATRGLRSRLASRPKDEAGAAGTWSESQRQPDGLERQVVDGTCGSCGQDDLRRYRVLAADGWFEVTKCQTCLQSASRVPWNRLGWITLGEEKAL